jgi:hypothetical protein
VPRAIHTAKIALAAPDHGDRHLDGSGQPASTVGAHCELASLTQVKHGSPGADKAVVLASGRATSSQAQDGWPRLLVVALYVAASMAVLASALSLPREAARTCAPSPEQADLEFCIETQRFVSSSWWDAALAPVLATTVITASVAWLRWRSVANARQQSGVVATLQFRVDRFRERILLLSVASIPLIAGLAIGATTSSSYTMGERTCRPGTGMVVEFCEQHSIETQRITRRASDDVASVRLVSALVRE